MALLALFALGLAIPGALAIWCFIQLAKA